MDFSYALGYEQHWEPWMFPYIVSLWLMICMLWSGLMASDRELTRYICYEAKGLTRFFGLGGGVIGVLCFMSAIYGGYLAPYFFGYWVCHSGGTLGAAIIAAVALIFGWIGMVCTMFGPRPYQQMKEVK
jgi:hypothetical protein